MVVEKYDEIPITGNETFLKRLTGKVTSLHPAIKNNTMIIRNKGNQKVKLTSVPSQNQRQCDVAYKCNGCFFNSGLFWILKIKFP